MRYMIFILVVLSSCEKTIQKAKINGDKMIVSPNFQDSFFYENDWSYNDFVEKDEKGYFINNGSEPIDTNHYQHFAKLISTINGEHEIKFGSAYYKNDSLILHFEDVSPAYFDALKIQIKGNFFTAVYESGTPVGGDSVFPMDKKELVIQKNTHQIGDTIKGKLKFEGYFPNKPSVRFQLKGAFKLPLIENKN